MANLSSLDWRSFQRFFSAQAADDLNKFLENLPHTAGQAALMAAGIAWMFGAMLGLYATVQVQKLTELRIDLDSASALQPIVPTVRDVSVSSNEIRSFAERMQGVYNGLTIRPQGGSILITSSSTSNFGQFREAIGHVQNGGAGWKVSVERLCVGRECDRDHLAALLKINKVSVDNPS